MGQAVIHCGRVEVVCVAVVVLEPESQDKVRLDVRVAERDGFRGVAGLDEAIDGLAQLEFAARGEDRHRCGAFKSDQVVSVDPDSIGIRRGRR